MASVTEVIAQLNVCGEKINNAAAMAALVSREMEELGQQYAGILSDLPGGERLAGACAQGTQVAIDLRAQIAALDGINADMIATQSSTGAG